MSAQSDFAGTFLERLKANLEIFARLISSCVPGAIWRVELPESRIYDVVALLTFMDDQNPSNELVVVALEIRHFCDGVWNIDATDRESLPLDLDGEPTVGSVTVDMSNVEAALGDIDARLQRWTDRIVRELLP